jgi:hypothetical protein
MLLKETEELLLIHASLSHDDDISKLFLQKEFPTQKKKKKSSDGPAPTRVCRTRPLGKGEVEYTLHTESFFFLFFFSFRCSGTVGEEEKRQQPPLKKKKEKKKRQGKK